MQAHVEEIHDYAGDLDFILEMPAPYRADPLVKVVQAMVAASEKDIIAARHMAGGALLTSDEP
eukprot:1379213-Rhodomonas_salina.1